MTTDRIWTSSSIRLFIQPQDSAHPFYVSCAKIGSIEWGLEISDICRYCGSRLVAGTCAGCGSRTPGLELDEALLTLVGFLPRARELFWVRPGCEILAQCGKCGDPRLFQPEETILKAICNKVANWWITGLGALGPDEEERLRLHLTIKCRAEVILP